MLWSSEHSNNNYIFFLERDNITRSTARDADRTAHGTRYHRWPWGASRHAGQAADAAAQPRDPTFAQYFVLF